MRTALRCAAALLAVSTLATASARVINLTEVQQVDLSALSADNTAANYIGTNPSALAWDGVNAYVGGYNNGVNGLKTGIVAVTGVLTTPTLGTAAVGQLATNASRGFTSLSLQGTTLGAGWDNGGGSGDSVRAFNTSTNSQIWRIGDPSGGNDTTRRGNGTAFDPGFNAGGTNQGLAYLSIGSGRRHVLVTSTGAYINGQNLGAIINSTSTTWRDVAFDPATGDLYARQANLVEKNVRTGDNAFAAGTNIGGFSTAGTIDQENITLGNVTDNALGNTLFVNDHTSNTTGQAFTSIIKSLDTTGNLDFLNWNFGAFGTPLAGAGNYDLQFDQATQTLAITDFINRQLYVFNVLAPEPGSLALLAAGGLMALRRRK